MQNRQLGDCLGKIDFFMQNIENGEKNLYIMTDQSVGKEKEKMNPIPKDMQKRERIIAAAMEVFSSEGLSKGTIADVAKQAGIGKGTVYEYFRSKDEIFQAMLDSFFMEMASQLQAMISGEMPYNEKLNLLIDSSFDLVNFEDKTQHRTWQMIFEIILYGMRQQEGSIDLPASFRSIIKSLEPLIDEGIALGKIKAVDPTQLSFLLFAALDGVGLHIFLQKGYYPVNELKLLLKRILLEGIFTEEEI